jgi:hypothetical protein
MAISSPRASLIVIPALLTLLLAGCSVPWAGRPRGEAVLHSLTCHCHLIYPASWWTTGNPGDPSRPMVGLDSFDSLDADHAPIPSRYASIGIDWQNDPIGQFYLAITTSRFSPEPAQHLTVSGWPATAYAHWTAPPSDGGYYEVHVYFFVPWYQRLYDVWLHAASPPGHDVSAQSRSFKRVLGTFTVVPPTATP